MKSRIVCVCAIAMLLVSTVAFGEIVSDGDWRGDSYGLGSVAGNTQLSTTTGYAEDVNNWGWGFGEGWKSSYTTVRAYCDWYYYVYVWTEAQLILWDGQLCYALAQAEASAECQGPNHQDADDLSAFVYVEDSGYNGYAPNDTDHGGYPFGIYKADSNWYNADQGISSEHMAVAVASVPQYSTNTAFCHADARAFCSLYEHP